ncbi:MAG: RNB domain-containing ribonuclease, partial [Pseudomonadota bacterium]
MTDETSDNDGAARPTQAGKRVRRSRVGNAGNGPSADGVDKDSTSTTSTPKSPSSGKLRKSSRKGPRAALPSRDEVLTFISESDGKVGKREIARAFGIRGTDKIGLKALLKEMAEDGLLKGNRKRLREPGKLPPVTVLQIVEREDDGEFICVPATWDTEEAPMPRGLIAEDRGAGDGLAGLGDRVLAYVDRFDAADDAGLTFSARVIRKLPRDTRQLLGIFRSHASRAGGSIEPVERKNLRSHGVEGDDTGGAQDGDLVRFELAGNRRLGPPRARITSVLGNPDDQRQISLIAVHAHGIPETFPQAALDELETLAPLDVEARDDLRDIPLITIDPPDARDHDDAVWAAPDDNPDNTGGWIVVVAIADVAHYVRPGSALDRSALERANSVYFPDRVVPMLPEKISNDLCSLRENEERPCLAIRMWFSASGKKIRHRVMRGIMCSRAKLSYVEAQAAIDGRPGPAAAPWLKPVLQPLWAAYAVLREAREKRSPLDLDLPERKIGIGDDGMVASITVPERLDAHRLIEEFMIQANVATAEIPEGLEFFRLRRWVHAVHEWMSPGLQDF